MYDRCKHGTATAPGGRCNLCRVEDGDWQSSALESVAPARDRQEGGDHYKTCAIQPIDYIEANGLGFTEGNVVKYVSRWRKKNGVEDLRKARHYLDLLIERAEHVA